MTTDLMNAIGQLSEEEQVAVSRFVTSLLQKRRVEVDSSREKIVATVLKSHEQAEEGKLFSWPSVRKELVRKYGLSA